ncbi:hypothetical protein CSE899_02144 [Cronobacter sakazakii E899]|nr:hypothetical protein CSE899_02144 [Cronobacter sakazakii E899]
MKSLKFCLAAGLLLLSPGIFADALNAQLTPFFCSVWQELAMR